MPACCASRTTAYTSRSPVDGAPAAKVRVMSLQYPCQSGSRVDHDKLAGGDDPGSRERVALCGVIAGGDDRGKGLTIGTEPAVLSLEIPRDLPLRAPDQAVGDDRRQIVSLTSIMSSSGSRKVSRPRRDAKRALLSKPRDPDDPESVVDHLVGVFGVIGSPAFPTDREALREQVARNVRRGHHPAGMTRQLVAIIASGDRRKLLRKIAAPTLVIHGADDPLVPVEAGRDTARHIAGAELMVIDGMGHDLAPGLVPILVEAIAAHCHRGEKR